MAWAILPSELREQIVDKLAEDCHGYRKLARPQRKGLAPYASVSFEWQKFVEQRTFQTLVVNQYDMVPFHHAIRRRRARLAGIRYLCLRIKLAPYDCEDCSRPESQQTIRSNNRFFTNAITNLLSVLSAGEGINHNHGITLELSAHSPSDFKHVFRNFKPAKNYPFITEEDLADPAAFDEYNSKGCLKSLRIIDPLHGFMEDGERKDPTDDAVERFRGSVPLDFVFGDEQKEATSLKTVRIVKELVIRRHFYRNFSLGALAKLLQSFEGLEMLRDEQGRPVKDEQEGWSNQNLYFETLHKAAPTSLQRLHIFRDDGDYPPLHSTLSNITPVVKYLARHSRNLKELSISSESDAQGFLEDFYPAALQGGPLPDLSWDCLQCLSLCCQPLSSLRIFEDLEQDPRDKIFRAAAVIASCMPKLETMELWHGNQAMTSIFRYSTKDNSPTITWQSTWKKSLQDGLILSPVAAKEWEKTAEQHCSGVLDIRRMSLPESQKGVQHSRGRTVIKYLELKRLILDPVSLRQVEWEAEYDRVADALGWWQK